MHKLFSTMVAASVVMVSFAAHAAEPYWLEIPYTRVENHEFVGGFGPSTDAMGSLTDFYINDSESRIPILSIEGKHADIFMPHKTAYLYVNGADAKLCLDKNRDWLANENKCFNYDINGFKNFPGRKFEVIKQRLAAQKAKEATASGKS